MKTGGCDKTWEMIEEWKKQTAGLLKESEHKAGHVGTCVNSFDRNSGECNVSRLPYHDVSHFATGVEGAHQISKEHFLKHATVPKHLESLANNKTTKFLHDKENGVHMMHDTKKDVHHFFTEDSTPSQLQGLDSSQDVGIVGGPLGEDDPNKKTVSTIKKVLKAKYTRKLI